MDTVTKGIYGDSKIALNINLKRFNSLVVGLSVVEKSRCWCN